MTLTGIHRSVLGTLLRHARYLTKNKSVIWLQKCPEVVEFGQPPVTTTHAADLSKVSLSFPKSLWLFLSSHVPSRVISGKDLRRIVRAGFRTNPLGGNVSELFQCAKLVSEQVWLMNATSVATTEDVRVVATTVYDKREEGRQRSFGDLPHAFYYRIAIENLREHPVKLTHRKWTFRPSDNSVIIEVPKLPGVVGYEPTILPGQIVQYMSMVYLATETGTMEGAFTMKKLESGESFEAQVAVCPLTSKVFVTE